MRLKGLDLPRYDAIAINLAFNQLIHSNCYFHMDVSLSFDDGHELCNLISATFLQSGDAFGQMNYIVYPLSPIIKVNLFTSVDFKNNSVVPATLAPEHWATAEYCLKIIDFYSSKQKGHLLPLLMSTARLVERVSVASFFLNNTSSLVFCIVKLLGLYLLDLPADQG